MICGKEFQKSTSRVTCSEECEKELLRLWQNKADIKRGKRKLPAGERYESTLPKSGVPGITWRKNGKWQATYKGKYIGVYGNLEDAKKAHIPYEKYKKIEDKLVIQRKLCPTTASQIICTVQYSSPKGRNRYTNTRKYDIQDVDHRYQKLLQHKNEVDSEDMRRKRERGKLTPKLRYSILSRDSFQCQLCGRGQSDGVKLHVDHIIPVSKGGKTVPENLRTLCDECNIGKSDTIE